MPETLTRKLTAAEALLLAASRLAADTPDETIYLPVLCLRARELDPKHFGLPGFERVHPCSARVRVELFKRPTGLLARGWLESVAPNVYRLTQAGEAKAVELARQTEGRR